MRIVWICILFTVVATAFLAAGKISASNENTVTTTARKLIQEVSDVGLDDYGPVDPSPSSKRVRPGPIQHGTPLGPYIPKPAPPPPRP